MALINCPECKKEISDKAQSCPHCGCPINAIKVEQTRKKWKGWQLIGCSSLFIGFLIIIAVAGSNEKGLQSIGVLIILFGIITSILAYHK